MSFILSGVNDKHTQHKCYMFHEFATTLCKATDAACNVQRTQEQTINTFLPAEHKSRHSTPSYQLNTGADIQHLLTS